MRGREIETDRERKRGRDRVIGSMGERQRGGEIEKERVRERGREKKG